jgi:hypothetical protein
VEIHKQKISLYFSTEISKWKKVSLNEKKTLFKAVSKYFADFKGFYLRNKKKRRLAPDTKSEMRRTGAGDV